MKQPTIKRQYGQAMAEYVVVLAFGVMVLTIGDPSPIERLSGVIKQNWQGYSFALSMSDTPDALNFQEAIDDGLDYNLFEAMLDFMPGLQDKVPELCDEMPSISVSDIISGEPPTADC